MTDYYAPTVTLDGKLLNTTREINGVTVLSGLEMKWGCEDWLSEVEPGKLTLRLLDPDGGLLSMVGSTNAQPITVSRVDGTVWSGIVEDAEAALIELTHPRIQVSWHVWEVTLTAVDELGRLGADRKHGPPANPISAAPKNQTHWGPDSMTGRRRALNDRSMVPILFTLPSGFGNEENSWSIDGKFAPLAGYGKQQNISVLSVLRRTMRANQSLARPYYLHSQGVIVEALPPSLNSDTGVTCTYVGGVIDLAQYGDSDVSAVALLDAGKFMIDGEIHLFADPASRITTVARTGRRERIEPDAKGQPTLSYEDETQQITTGAKQLETCTASYDTDLSPEWWDTIAPMMSWARPEWWRDVHQKTGPGILTYQQDVTDTASLDTNLALLRPEPALKLFEKFDPSHPAYSRFHTLYGFNLARSLTNLMPSCRDFAILGGTLTYDARTGWQHDLTTAPTGKPGVTPRPTLGDVTNPAQIGDARPGIRLADLARITHL